MIVVEVPRFLAWLNMPSVRQGAGVGLSEFAGRQLSCQSARCSRPSIVVDVKEIWLVRRSRPKGGRSLCLQCAGLLDGAVGQEEALEAVACSATIYEPTAQHEHAP